MEILKAVGREWGKNGPLSSRDIGYEKLHSRYLLLYPLL